MDRAYQELYASLSGHYNVLLTSLLCCQDEESWQNSKHLVICSMPFLTLEMAIKRVTDLEKHSIPSPSDIYKALNYAKKKHKQAIKIQDQEEVSHI